MEAYVRDTETLVNCTVGIYTHYKTGETKVFVISPFQNDFVQWVNFLENCADNGDYLIGFNSLSFDAQIEQSMLKHRDKLELLTAGEISEKIHDKAQKIISEQEYGDNKSTGIPEWLLSIRQIDVFKINHWDNPARKSSLKWLQFTMDWKSVQEMPISHGTVITTQQQVDMIVEYCKNDTAFTGLVYERTKPMIKIRQDLKKKYKRFNCLNYSDAKLGSELLLYLYCKKTKKKRFDVKQGSTGRKHIHVKDIIFPYIKFESDEFNDTLDKFIGTTITSTKGEVDITSVFKGYEFFYGAGGIHQASPGIYKSDEEYILLDVDVGSLYPSVGCENSLYPAHLGIEFFEVFKEDIVAVRLAEKAKGKNGDKSIVAGFKLSANAAVGNTNNKYSWLFDPQYNMTVTINGQLSISMLIEQLLLKTADTQLIQTNTDGATFRVLRSEVDSFKELCKDWEKITGLQLEFQEMDSIWLGDVNNYLAEFQDGKVKAKGRFEYEDLEPHKNKSFLVVSKAIKEYLVNGIIPEDYLKTNRNIFDYCGGSRAVGDWEFKGICVVDGEVKESHMQKVVRYYISNGGCKIVKVNKSDGRRISTIAGPWLQHEFNLFQELPWDQYDVNDSFYLNEIYKEIGALSIGKSKQLSLFE